MSGSTCMDISILGASLVWFLTGISMEQVGLDMIIYLFLNLYLRQASGLASSMLLALPSRRLHPCVHQMWSTLTKVQPILQILKRENHVNLVLARCTISIDAWIGISRVASL